MDPRPLCYLTKFVPLPSRPPTCPSPGTGIVSPSPAKSPPACFLPSRPTPQLVPNPLGQPSAPQTRAPMEPLARPHKCLETRSGVFESPRPRVPAIRPAGGVEFHRGTKDPKTQKTLSEVWLASISPSGSPNVVVARPSGKKAPAGASILRSGHSRLNSPVGDPIGRRGIYLGLIWALTHRLPPPHGIGALALHLLPAGESKGQGPKVLPAGRMGGGASKESGPGQGAL